MCGCESLGQSPAPCRRFARRSNGSRWLLEWPWGSRCPCCTSSRPYTRKVPASGVRNPRDQLPVAKVDESKVLRPLDRFGLKSGLLPASLFAVLMMLILFGVRFLAPDSPDVGGDRMRDAIDTVRRLGQLPESTECSRLGSTSMSRMTCRFAVDIRRVGLEPIAARMIPEGWCYSDPVTSFRAVLARGNMALVLEREEVGLTVSAFYYRTQDSTRCAGTAQ
jgi:hypothetical protein